MSEAKSYCFGGHPSAGLIKKSDPIRDKSADTLHDSDLNILDVGDFIMWQNILWSVFYFQISLVALERLILFSSADFLISENKQIHFEVAQCKFGVIKNCGKSNGLHLSVS